MWVFDIEMGIEIIYIILDSKTEKGTYKKLWIYWINRGFYFCN